MRFQTALSARAARRFGTAAAAGCLVLLLTTAPGGADPAATGSASDPVVRPISPSEFRSYAEGYTLYFERDGRPFGAERFESGGRTTWQFIDGGCADGVWRPHGAQICFFYGQPGEEGADPFEVLCWRLLRDGEGILARLLGEGADAGMELRIVRRDRLPLVCEDAGPEL